MLFEKRFWAGLSDGSVTLAFRHWKRPTVRAGGTLQSPAGVLCIDAVERAEPASITAADAAAAGYPDREALLAELERRAGADRALYRIAFHFHGEDPRRALRERTQLDAGELAELRARLARLDRRSSHGPWTRRVLELIRDRPATLAGDLAAELGRERLAFKTDVRKLKALGLTESLRRGYRLSPRGRALLELEGRGGRASG